MQFLGIVLFAVVAAVCYGILHDQVTARICVEYFTIGHPPVFQTQSPTLLAIGWGVIATWWVGLILGIPLAMTARLGKWPKKEVRDLVKPVLVLLCVMGGCALLAGLVGHLVARQGWVFLVEPLASRVPKARHVGFITALWAHVASYGSGFLGGVIAILWTGMSRRRAARELA